MQAVQDNSVKNAAFKRAYEAYSRLVYSLAYSYMKNSPDANDIVQDVFLKFYQHMDALDDEKRLRPWLITVTANACKNELRSSRLTKAFSGDILDDIPYDEDFGEESELFLAVMKLPEKERIPIHLYYYEGYSAADISKMLKIKESTIRVRLMRARSKLKKYLEEGSV